MDRCGNCGKRIVLGGERNRLGRFCNEKCMESNLVNRVREVVPADQMQAHVLHAATCGCPVCGVDEPVDVYKFSTIYSLILFTWTRDREIVSCRACARKKQGLALVLSGLCGWWGFPWGLLKTPFVLLMNLIELTKGAPAQPTFKLHRVVELNVARTALLGAEEPFEIREAA